MTNEDRKTISEAAENLFDKDVFTLTVKVREQIAKRTLLDRLSGKELPTERVFVIKPATVGTMLRIASKAVLLPETIFDGPEASTILPLIHNHIEDLVYIVAAAIQNNKHEPDHELIEFIKNNFDAKDLFDVLGPTLKNIDMASFFNSIVLVKGTERILLPKSSPLDGSE